MVAALLGLDVRLWYSADKLKRAREGKGGGGARSAELQPPEVAAAAAAAGAATKTRRNWSAWRLSSASAACSDLSELPARLRAQAPARA